jgi:hypothetical protein
MSFAAIFLQVKAFPVSSSDILPVAIKLLKDKETIPLRKEFDAFAMLGHRIGMLENSSGIKQYLQDIGSSHVYNNLQIQQVNLTGPFFALLRVKSDALQKQAAAANWQFEIIWRQDEINYLARLSPRES